VRVIAPILTSGPGPARSRAPLSKESRAPRSAGSDPTSCGRTGFVLLGIHVWHAVEFSRFGTHTEEGRLRPASGQPPQPTRRLEGCQVGTSTSQGFSGGPGDRPRRRPFLSPSRETLGRPAHRGQIAPV
jgi:hypothetical protein